MRTDGGTASDPHLGFGLKTEGDGVYLYDKAGVLVDSVEFGLQLPDLSIGRVGPLGEWRLTVPTFGKANVARPLGRSAHGPPQRVAGQQRSPFGLGLHRAVQLSRRSGGPGGHGPHGQSRVAGVQAMMRPLSFIAGHGYGVLWADDSNEPGHLGFRLSADGGVIALYDAQAKVVDKVIYSPQTTDFSEGRAPDGAASLAILPLPTPGLANPQVQKTTANDRRALVEEKADKRVLVPTGGDQRRLEGGAR